MTWKTGDTAIIQCFGPSRDKVRVEGEFCTLRQYMGDTKAGGGFVPDAWLVQIHAPGYMDMVLVSKHALKPIERLTKMVSWSEVPWQPIEYLRYP